MWSTVLKSDKYTQGNGMLIVELPTDENQRVTACCMGVLEHVCGVEFIQEDDDIYRDEWGADEMPADIVANAAGLTQKVTFDEVAKLEEMFEGYDSEMLVREGWSRKSVLAQFNDELEVDFEGIAEALIKLEWDVSIEEVKEAIR